MNNSTSPQSSADKITFARDRRNRAMEVARKDKAAGRSSAWYSDLVASARLSNRCAVRMSRERAC